ncbi:MAG: DUF5606 domain-containing protein, partial [Bacteroidales bacterium]|nr:DUF5606 domain-containing protein [Bacteroidales bacterium]
MEKTDLKKVISVSGQPGLFRYVAQGKSGVILEAMATGNRTMFGITAKMTTLADVSVYTESAEVALKQLFENMKAKLS